MEQRPLRLGDILDDYCPRERRVTNHAVVAMVEEDVKQTRCTTCDAEHAYKGGRAPKRRKAETPAALYKEVLAGMPEADVPVLAAASVLPAIVLPTAHVIPPVDALASARIVSAHPSTEEVPPQMHSDDNDRPAPIPAQRPTDDSEVTARSEDEPPVVDGPVHRPLIRATLPRPEGQKDVRQVTDF